MTLCEWIIRRAERPEPSVRHFVDNPTRSVHPLRFRVARLPTPFGGYPDHLVVRCVDRERPLGYGFRGAPLARLPVDAVLSCAHLT
jgi:hypothetical protein